MGGLDCRYFGLKWNEGSGYHMIYWIPLEIWGWLFIWVGGVNSVLIIAAILKTAIVG
jgi:hypothetical protein